jgi:hypothetical protein
LDVYDNTPAGEVRRALAEGSFVIRGDAGRTADAMIAAADQAKPPFRLVLGSTAYNSVCCALERRLAEVREQRELAFAADRNDESAV